MFLGNKMKTKIGIRIKVRTKIKGIGIFLCIQEIFWTMFSTYSTYLIFEETTSSTF